MKRLRLGTVYYVLDFDDLDEIIIEAEKQHFTFPLADFRQFWTGELPQQGHYLVFTEEDGKLHDVKRAKNVVCQPGGWYSFSTSGKSVKNVFRGSSMDPGYTPGERPHPYAGLSNQAAPGRIDIHGFSGYIAEWRIRAVVANSMVDYGISINVQIGVERYSLETTDKPVFWRLRPETLVTILDT